MSNAPDEYSNLWYRQQFRGVMHSLNRCNSDYVDLLERLKSLQVQVDSLIESRVDLMAEIGRLRDTIDNAREAFRDIKREMAAGDKEPTDEE